MNHKNLIRAFALILVLVLCIGVFAACDKKNDTPTGEQKKTDDKVAYLQEKSSATKGFVEAMFSSANKMGEGITVDTSAGNNIAINLGLTVTISKDSTKLPIDIYVKGFVDRNPEHLENNNGVYSLKSNNETKLDVCISAANIESMRLFFQLESDTEGGDAYGVIYATVAGNNVKIKLDALGTNEDGQSIEDALFNLFEKLLKEKVVEGIANAFADGKFDLNTALSGLINSFMGDTTLASIIMKIDNETIRDAICSIFGGEANMQQVLGSKIDLQYVLSNFGEMIFTDVIFNVNGIQKDYSYIKYNAYQPMNASMTVGGDLVDIIIGGSTLSGAVTIGFKTAAGTQSKDGSTGSIGKMDEFYIDIDCNGIDTVDTDQGRFGIKIAITDLKMGNEAKVASIAIPNPDDYEDRIAFDAGFDIDIPEDLLNVVIHKLDGADEDNKDIKISAGKALSYDDTGAVINATIPSDIHFNIKGKLDIFDASGTLIVGSLTAGSGKSAVDIINLQVYGAKDGTLTAEAKIASDFTGDQYKLSIAENIMMMVYRISGYSKIGTFDFGYKLVGDDPEWSFDKIKNTNISAIFDELMEKGVIRVTGINTTELLNFAINNKNKEFEVATANDATATADEATRISGNNGKETFDFIWNTLGSKSTGLIATIYQLLTINEGESLVIGGENIISTLFATLYPNKTGAITPYVSIGNLISGNSNIYNAYEAFEYQIYKLSARGISTEFSSKEGDYIRIESADTKATEISTKIAEYKQASTAEERSVIALEINELGYALVETEDGDFVQYPLVLYKELKYLLENKAFKADAKASQSVKDEVAANNKFFNDNGFTVIVTKDNTGTDVATMKSVSISSLKTAFEEAMDKVSVADGNYSDSYFYTADIKNTIIQLMRRGVIATPVKTESGWDFNYSVAFIDDAILANADATVSIYTKVDGDRVTEGGVEVKAVFNEKTVTIKLYNKFITEDDITVSYNKNFFGKNNENAPANSLVFKINKK